MFGNYCPPAIQWRTETAEFLQQVPSQTWRTQHAGPRGEGGGLVTEKRHWSCSADANILV